MNTTEKFKEFYDGSFEEALPQEFLEQYEILECLSCGEGGDTLLVRQKTSEGRKPQEGEGPGGQKAVAKCYPKNSVLYDMQEAAGLADSEGAGIPRFMGKFQNEEYACVLREYIEGRSLDEFVKQSHMTEELLIQIATGIAQAMKQLHDAKPPIIHRDIKPQNIIVKEDKSIALIDFGISRAFKEGGTADTVFCGTEDFAPPEQYGFMQTDVRSDIYSFGIVLSWMITGEAKPIREPMTKLERVAAKCCEFSPNKRYKDDEALLRDLHKTTRQYAIYARRRTKVIATAVLLLAVALFVGGSMYLTSLRDKGVKFREPLIEEAVRATLNKPDGIITESDLEAVMELYVQGEEVYASENAFYSEGGKWYALDVDSRNHGTIKDLSDLADMPNLRAVCLGAQNITDISPLKDLKYLSKVEFRDNSIRDISPLADKTMLENVSMVGNPLRSIETIVTWPALSRLDLFATGMYDGSPVETLKRMTRLDIRNDSDAYQHLEGLWVEELALGASGQTDVECIRNVSYVARLYIYWSDISDISALEGREDIVYLNMVNCPVDDLSPLFTIPNLQTVAMSETGREQMDQLISFYGEPAFQILYSK